MVENKFYEVFKGLDIKRSLKVLKGFFDNGNVNDYWSLLF